MAIIYDNDVRGYYLSISIQGKNLSSPDLTNEEVLKNLYGNILHTLDKYDLKIDEIKLNIGISTIAGPWQPNHDGRIKQPVIRRNTLDLDRYCKFDSISNSDNGKTRELFMFIDDHLYDYMTSTELFSWIQEFYKKYIVTDLYDGSDLTDIDPSQLKEYNLDKIVNNIFDKHQLPYHCRNTRSMHPYRIEEKSYNSDDMQFVCI